MFSGLNLLFDVRQEQYLVRFIADLGDNAFIGTVFAFVACARIKISGKQSCQIANAGIGKQQFLRLY